MLKTKRKSNKSVKIPKPIKIKKEKVEEDRTLQPMSHYVDDRLELIKQIFGTLKPKTITNLAPEFLKKKDLDEIQELCLNELLGISTKRLLSIINATQCPSDTDTSSDSDVHNIEEHVSLEEISSDSEIEDGSKKTKKKKSAGSGNNKIKSKKDAGKNSGENDGQISVLELLELQARARAIRSQLALEPVTKIEVNSDDESDGAPSVRPKENTSRKRKETKRKSSDQLTATTDSKTKEPRKGSPKQLISNGNADASSTSSDRAAETGQKIKLKRNFRINKQTADNESPEKMPADVQISSNIKKEQEARSASPDVIPIVAEPVTLMIGDSSDEDNVAEADVAENVVNRGNSPAAETPATSLPDQANKSTEATEVDAEIFEQSLSSSKEPEDGEIIDETEDNCTASTEGPNNIDGVVPAEMMKGAKPNADEDKTTDQSDNNKATEQIADDEIKAAAEVDHPSQENELKRSKAESIPEEYDDDQNDDVISIEGGDLENEMTEHLEENSSKPSTATQSYKIASCDQIKDPNEESAKNSSGELCEDDIISLDSSEDDLTKESTESWNSRWLRSSKVSKVLATSRLGKRVRDKIKKTAKRPLNDPTRDGDKATPSDVNTLYTSKHEDGSIEQYKELLEMRQQRKN